MLESVEPCVPVHNWPFVVHTLIGALQALGVAWLMRRRYRKDALDSRRWTQNYDDHAGTHLLLAGGGHAAHEDRDEP